MGRRKSWETLRSMVIILVAVGVLMGWPVAVAQEDEEPDPGVNATAGLPSETLFGDGWSQAEVLSPDSIDRYGFTMSPDVFREGAAGIYLGPDGGRAGSEFLGE